MSDTGREGEQNGLLAHRCPNGHTTYPGHATCPDCGREQTDTVDLRDEVGKVLTWTKSTATPTGVLAPNTVAVVAFEVDGEEIRVVGGTTGDVAVGNAVEPVYVAELRDPGAGIRPSERQAWDGYRFRPIE